MNVREIMTPNPASVTPDAQLREVARIMKDSDVGVVPVVESTSSRRVVGMVTDRDIAIRVVAEGRAPDDVRVRDIMTSDVKTAKEGDSVDAVMRTMASEKVRRVPVVNDRDELVGIVAQADIVREGSDHKAEETIERISEPGGKHSQ